MTNRYISKKIRQELIKSFGARCGFPGCWKPAMALHHTKRFALARRHLADELVPLCKIHHELAHVGSIKNEELEAGKWSVELERQTSAEVDAVDRLTRKGRLASRKKC